MPRGFSFIGRPAQVYARWSTVKSIHVLDACPLAHEGYYSFEAGSFCVAMGVMRANVKSTLTSNINMSQCNVKLTDVTTDRKVCCDKSLDETVALHAQKTGRLPKHRTQWQGL